MADVTEFPMMMNAQLLQTLQMGLAQLQTAAQLANAQLAAAVNAAVQAAKPAGDEAPPQQSHVRGL